MGEPKQFLPHRGRSLIRCAVDAALKCTPVVVVTGREHDRIRHELDGVAAEAVYNPGWQLGIGNSIKTGVQRALEIAPALDLLIILACDQPFVSARLIAALCDYHEQHGSLAVASFYAGGRGVPALFDRALFPVTPAPG